MKVLEARHSQTKWTGLSHDGYCTATEPSEDNLMSRNGQTPMRGFRLVISLVFARLVCVPLSPNSPAASASHTLTFHKRPACCQSKSTYPSKVMWVSCDSHRNSQSCADCAARCTRQRLVRSRAQGMRLLGSAPSRETVAHLRHWKQHTRT